MVCVCDCSSVSPDQLDIIQDFSRDGLPTSLVEIGREISVNFTVTNNGPSAIGQGRLTIYLPYRNPCTVNGFLFYITSVSVCLPYAYTYSCACLWYTYVLHMYIRTYVDMCIYSTHIHVCINSCLCHTHLFVSHPLVFMPHPLVLMSLLRVFQVANLQNGICTASPMDSINVLQLTLPSSGGQGGEEVANGTDTSTTMGGAAPTLDDIPGTCNTEGGQTQTVVSLFQLA